MPSYPENSVGLVEPQKAAFSEPFQLDSGDVLNGFELVYETYGELNADASNAVLVCHALTGDHHAAGYHQGSEKPGWWNVAIGPGKPVDTNRFFVVSVNNIGGCKGSTGPLSINPQTNEPYGRDFPIVTIQDWVRSQALLADHLGIQQWAAGVGGSMGGMQILQWAIDYPERIRNTAIIAAAPGLSAQNIAFNEVSRTAIRSDPDYHDGNYAKHGTVPTKGLSIARMVGHITYLSDDSMAQKFGRARPQNELSFGYGIDFEVESYLRYQAKRFVERFDANSYLLLTKTLDYFDPARDHGHDLVAACRRIKARNLVLSFKGDWRFSSGRSKEIVKAMLDAGCDVSYADLDSRVGHDDFLLDIPQYLDIFSAWMEQV